LKALEVLVIDGTSTTLSDASENSNDTSLLDMINWAKITVSMQLLYDFFEKIYIS
jgi:uncharacterized membrane protein YjfL (UPF0719 family)